LGYLANPTEIQWALSITIIFTGFVAPDWWNETVDVYGYSLTKNEIYIYNIAIGIVISVISNAIVGYNCCREKKISFKKYIAPLFPYIVIVVLSIIWNYLSSLLGHDILKKHTLTFYSLFGFEFSYLCNQLVISRICRMDIPFYNHVYLIPIIGIISTILNIESTVLPILFYGFLFHYFNFCYSVSNQLLIHLKIRFFVIPYKKE